MLVLNMDCVSECAQGRFLNRFAKRGVCVDRTANIFQACPHFQRLGECSAQLRHAAPCCLPSEDEVVVFARDDAYETLG